MPLVGISCAAIFTPWVLLWALLTPLPDTIQEQVNTAIDQGLDGIIVYVNQSNESTFYSAGWKNKRHDYFEYSFFLKFHYSGL